MPTPKLRSLLALALISGALLVGGAWSLRADGDPNENYDFSGSVWPKDFAERMVTVEERWGKWTFQFVSHQEPFSDTWEPEVNQHTNIFYGTMPVQRLRGNIEEQGENESWGKPAPSPASHAEFDLLYDLTGSGAACFVMLNRWSRGSPSENTLSVYRLDESQDKENPASSKITLLHTATCNSLYPILDDFDGDGKPEIYNPMGYGGAGIYATWGVLVGFFPSLMTWDTALGKYVQADPTLLANTRGKGASRIFLSAQERASAMQQRCDNERDAWLKAIEGLAEGEKLDGETLFGDLLYWSFLNYPRHAAEVMEAAEDKSIRLDHDSFSATEFWNLVMPTVVRYTETFRKWSPEVGRVAVGSDASDTRPWRNLLGG